MFHPKSQYNWDLIQLHKCLLHTTKKPDKRAHHRLFLQPVMRWYPLISPLPGELFKHGLFFGLRSYLYVNAIALCLQWRKRAQVPRFVLTHSHTYLSFLPSCPLISQIWERKKKWKEGLSSFASEEADGGLVFLFPFVLLAPSADGSSSCRPAVWLRHTTRQNPAFITRVIARGQSG